MIATRSLAKELPHVRVSELPVISPSLLEEFEKTNTPNEELGQQILDRILAENDELVAQAEQQPAEPHPLVTEPLPLTLPDVSEPLLPRQEPHPPIAEPHPALADKRFQEASEEELANFSKDHVPKNTEYNTKWAISTFTSWMTYRSRQGLERYPENLLREQNPQELNTWLKIFAVEVRKLNGDLYPLTL